MWMVSNLPIGVFQAQSDADADLVIGLHDGIEVPILERIERQHVLNGGHAGTQAFQAAEAYGAHFLDRPRRILRRRRIEPPGFNDTSSSVPLASTSCER